MAASDPTYPLYPVACILSATMLLLVLLTSFIRQNWNLGVAFLCFWLFVENLTSGINAIIWSDNADIKLYIYCDILTRRLYLIANLRSVELPNTALRRRNLAIEWTLGLAIPALVAGPFYYIVQGVRFVVAEGFGCVDNPDVSLLGILLIWSWAIILPLLSITIYHPRIIRIFYHQRRDMNQFLQSNNSVSRTNYFRVFALASIDIILTLPMGIVNIALVGRVSLAQIGHLPLYSGWTLLHTDWEPNSFSYSETISNGTPSVVQTYFTQWSSPVLAFAIFSLFGVTAEARAAHWRVICTIGGWFGWKPILRTRARSPLGTMQFGERPHDVSLNLDLESQSSYVDPDSRAEQVVKSEGGLAATRELESGMDAEIIEEPQVVSQITLRGGHSIQHHGTPSL